jgi:hypothetical protein
MFVSGVSASIVILLSAGIVGMKPAGTIAAPIILLFGQWLGIRRYFPVRWGWVPASLIAGAVAAFPAALLGVAASGMPDQAVFLAGLMLFAAPALWGAVIGFVQGSLLRETPQGLLRWTDIFWWTLASAAGSCMAAIGMFIIAQQFEAALDRALPGPRFFRDLGLDPGFAFVDPWVVLGGIMLLAVSLGVTEGLFLAIRGARQLRATPRA